VRLLPRMPVALEAAAAALKQSVLPHKTQVLFADAGFLQTQQWFSPSGVVVKAMLRHCSGLPVCGPEPRSAQRRCAAARRQPPGAAGQHSSAA
jgi:hypothetical protein